MGHRGRHPRAQQPDQTMLASSFLEALLAATLWAQLLGLGQSCHCYLLFPTGCTCNFLRVTCRMLRLLNILAASLQHISLFVCSMPRFQEQQCLLGSLLSLLLQWHFNAVSDGPHNRAPPQQQCLYTVREKSWLISPH